MSHMHKVFSEIFHQHIGQEYILRGENLECLFAFKRVLILQFPVVRRENCGFDLNNKF